MSNEVSVKETLEALKALSVVATTAGKIYKDKKLGLDDMAHLPELFLNFSTLEAGVTDISKAKDELKNLDQAELISIVGGVYEVFEAFEAAKK